MVPGHEGGRSVLKDWVIQLPLRHQGVLVTVIRGCDTAPKNDPSKLLSRCIREVVLNAFVGDPSKATTFIEKVSIDVLFERMQNFRKNLDHYPHHYVMHLIHAVEIIGYHYPDDDIRMVWNCFYGDLCRGLHVNPETKTELDQRLTLDEQAFGAANRA